MVSSHTSISSPETSMSLVAATAAFLLQHVSSATALDNGIRLPPMGWSSWYGFTQHISEDLITSQALGMVQSGLAAAGYQHIWVDDGWAIGRHNVSGKPIEDRALFPSGMANLSSYVHSLGLKFGIYTSKGDLTCLGFNDDQPNRPGSCGYERIDAQVYADEWQVDAVKDDGCGACADDPFAVMSRELNRTGRHILLSIHGDPVARSEYPEVANMWRTGDDLWASSFDMWNNRLDLATADDQAALAGPGALPNPDFLQVGYSPMHPKGKEGVMTALEQRAMFTMWAALPGPLILSADLRPGAKCGGTDEETLETLTNPEIIAINQDEAVNPMRPIRRKDGLEVWRKPLIAPGKEAVILFHRGVNTTGPMPNPPLLKEIGVSWNELGYDVEQKVEVRDLWQRKSLGVHAGSFEASVREREALIYTFAQQEWLVGKSVGIAR